MKTYAISALTLLMSATLFAEDYAIKMQHPSKVGERFKYTASGNKSAETIVTLGSKIVSEKKEDLNANLESEAAVLEVDLKGRPTKVSYVIAHLAKGAEKEVVLPAGTKVVAMRPGKEMVFEIDGKPASKELAKVLGVVIAITSDGPTDDEAFGSQERRKIGESWNINVDLLKRDLSEKMADSGLRVVSVTGNSALQKVTQQEGVDVLHLASNMNAKTAPGPTGPFATAVTTMTAVYSGAFPADAVKGTREERVNITYTLNGTGKPDANGQVRKLKRISKESAVTTFKVLP